MFDISKVRFDAQGLVPAVVQDFESGKVLMLAYMNRESLDITLREKCTCFWSRSRGALWRKGESSGNVQHVVAISADCDADALLVQVVKDGPACHTGAESCFFEEIYRNESRRKFSLEELYRLIEGRKAEKKEGSYTSYLFEKGLEKILKKVGEECTEVVIAAMKGSDAEAVFEISDLCYHVLVLMAYQSLSPADILKELEGRHVVDKKVKQESLQ